MSTIDFKWAFYDPEIDAYTGKKHYILLFWHENILCPLFFRRHSLVTMLTSQHTDAEAISQAAHFLGMKCVRGSSYHGGSTAIKEMLTLKEHDILAFTPDGPRGPYRKMAPGAVYLASKLQMPVVLLGAGYNKPWRTPTWDNFAVPKPFSRGRIITSPFIDIPPKLSKSGLEYYRQKCETLLTELTGEAEAWAASDNHIAGESVVCMGPKSSLMYYGYSKPAEVELATVER
ncbi:hypothetical protein FACS189419_08220 [Planctomycetales bacterium]|nr:hypothetical protein FACS189419_08220 [Planctomycetales bacterium]